MITSLSLMCKISTVKLPFPKGSKKDIRANSYG